MAEHSPRMDWPFPTREENPWWEKFVAFVRASDSSVFAAREDRNLIMSGGGTLTWDTGNLTWTEPFRIFSPSTGFFTLVAATTLAVADGQVIRAEIVRHPGQNNSVAAEVATFASNTDNSLIIGLRQGDYFYFRSGQAIANGTSISSESFFGGTGGAPASHATQHQNGGTDEVNVTGLSGLLADSQTPLAHASSHYNGQSDELDVASLGGFPGTSTTVLRGDAVFGLPVATGGGGGLGETAVVDVRLAEFVVEGHELSSSATFEAIGTMFVASGGTAEVRLYDLGEPGSPAAPVLRSTLVFLNVNANVPNRLTQSLTAVALPAAPNNNEIHNVSHIYEVRVILDPSDAGADGDALHITKVRFF